MQDLIARVTQNLIGWDRVVALYHEIGRAMQVAAMAESTDELLEALDYLKKVREAHKQEIAAFRHVSTLEGLYHETMGSLAG